ncbi:MAG: hypothetical protein KGM47_16950 [Acidobacteriota bacterium]|nr:hypothetical protein [Acidobacteriota bacterium]
MISEAGCVSEGSAILSRGAGGDKDDGHSRLGKSSRPDREDCVRDARNPNGAEPVGFGKWDSTIIDPCGGPSMAGEMRGRLDLVERCYYDLARII